MKKFDIARYAPPGISLAPMEQTFMWGGIAALVWSFGFFIRLMEARSDLFRHMRNQLILKDGALMPDYAELLGHALTGFAVLALVMAAFAVYNYAYHRQGSKSIYLMRRLPNGWELHRRCLAIPAVTVLICLLAAFILLCLYYLIYLLVTPDVCLVPGQWQKLWRVWI